MILQPIVENSIKHGISKKTDLGKISISTQKNDKRLKIVVTDNGGGIPESKIPFIKNTGIGLSSIDERLKVLYENDYSFDIESTEEKETKVILSIPVTQEI